MWRHFSELLPPLHLDEGQYRELEILERLRDYLPAGFEVFRNVALHRVRGGRDAYGESDVIMLAPNGAMPLMEVKAGAIALRDGAIFKLYGDGTCNVARQEHLQRVVTQNRLQEARLETTLISCLVLPDYTLGDSQVVSIPREHIIDAARYGEMVSTVRDGSAPPKVAPTATPCAVCC